MSSMFSTPKPQPLPPPEDPSVSAAAEEARVNASNAAIAAQKSAGRASTIVAGMKIAADDQYARGALAQKKRGASSDLVGQ